MSTPLSEQTLAEKLEILGRKHAVSHFEKGNFVDSPNEEVQKWLDRNHIQVGIGEFDPLYDSYCKGFQSYHVEKWIVDLTPEQAADLRQRLLPTVCLDESKTLEWGKRRDENEETLSSIRGETSSVPVSSPSAASGVIPAPLVPDAVKVALEALERIKNWHCDCTWPESYRDDVRAVAESALSALRLLTSEGASVCEVEPLGEVNGDVIRYHDGDDLLTLVKWDAGFLTLAASNAVSLSRTQVTSLIAHLQAWLDTGSFDLKGLTSSPPSSEDKEPGISIGYLEPVQYEIIKELCRSLHILGAPIGMLAALGSWGDTLTDEEVLELLQAENAQASTTPQKGGQGV